jgi:hypothetical protein
MLTYMPTDSYRGRKHSGPSGLLRPFSVTNVAKMQQYDEKVASAR